MRLATIVIFLPTVFFLLHKYNCTISNPPQWIRLSKKLGRHDRVHWGFTNTIVQSDIMVCSFQVSGKLLYFYCLITHYASSCWFWKYECKFLCVSYVDFLMVRNSEMKILVAVVVWCYWCNIASRHSRVLKLKSLKVENL